MHRVAAIESHLSLKDPDRRAVLVCGVRTPFTRAFGEQLGMDTIDLGCEAVRGLLNKSKLPPSEIDHVAWGGVMMRSGCPNTAREIVIDLDLPLNISAHTETMACASGMKSILSAMQLIESGNADVVVAGGSDSVSCTEVPLARDVSQSLALYSSGKISSRKLVSVAGYPWKWLPTQPSIAERSTGKSMGFHADMMAELCRVPRSAQDLFAMDSHKKAAAAIKAGLFSEEIIPVKTKPVKHRPAITITKDTLVRAQQDSVKIASLRPVFRKTGTITAATASPLTDGAAAVLMMSAKKAKSLGYAADIAIRSFAMSGINPQPNLLLAPALAIPVALRRAGLTLADIDFFEIHEAFAGQVLATIQVLASQQLCQRFLKRSDAVGTIPADRVNIYGGSVSIGHPFGATGARLATNAARILRTHPSSRYVLVSICAAGGLGLVVIFERL
mmetsp:Transcript_37143/g.43373  ORF Transcript_37143/g.43373 Transcript_37143/m.43373 type:complete len:445 (+) Transcript_37143:27-1361(+)|eukprot:CAMPEP_0176428504 /NCGR_PEP_ID=MMETSP0127-20121128/13188_1 /TAXON_ID=938130 /ORGANISM="Platyophrya macrostoma, Strain WH" /LENGTH=444 /DNA_ID=CAMNT_0017810197 /DNA_START=93 /DNA_END=1427 /DNA_ORIENTATION=-